MNKSYKYTLYMVFAALLLMACSKNDERKTTPWGTPLEDSDHAAVTERQQGYAIAMMDDIRENGELIVLTLTGPDTYYDYRGHGLGVQYMMCEEFAARLGLTTRVEVCKDTLDLISKLAEGYGDVIAVPLKKRLYNNKVLRYCGAYMDSDSVKGDRRQWAVHESNEALADSLDRWFRADMPKKMLEHEDFLLARAVTHSQSWLAASPSALRVSRSTYNSLFQRYAPMAGIPWQLMARQCQQESGFDPGARSWAGACGLMQLMPSTAARFGLSVAEIYHPEKNIATSAKVMASLMREFRDIPSQQERICFALAGYNAGPGHIRDAMALARQDGRSPYSWAVVSAYVLRLSQPEYYQSPLVRYGYMRGQETVGYVAAILK